MSDASVGSDQSRSEPWTLQSWTAAPRRAVSEPQTSQEPRQQANTFGKAHENPLIVDRAARALETALRDLRSSRCAGGMCDASDTRILVMAPSSTFMEIWKSCARHASDAVDAALRFDYAEGSTSPLAPGDKFTNEAWILKLASDVLAQRDSMCPEQGCRNATALVFVAVPDETSMLFGHRCRIHAKDGARAFTRHAYPIAAHTATPTRDVSPSNGGLAMAQFGALDVLSRYRRNELPDAMRRLVDLTVAECHRQPAAQAFVDGVVLGAVQRWDDARAAGESSAEAKAMTIASCTLAAFMVYETLAAPDA